MFGYLIRRILATIPVMAVVALFVFLLLRLTPGDPAAILAGDNATPEQLERIRVSLGLHEPLYTQFFTWVGKLAHGDLGVSLSSNVPVLKIISQRVEPSISIALSTIILSVLIAVPLGVIAAWKHGTWIDRFVMGLSVLGFSVPVFVIGYVLIQVFAIDLRWLPVQGFKSISAGTAAELGRCRAEAGLGRAPPSDANVSWSFANCLSNYLCGPSRETYERTMERCCRANYSAVPASFCPGSPDAGSTGAPLP